MNLQGMRIILGVTGGIAAYKSAQIVRLLKKAGADVQVIMTEAAKAFITPLTLQALSGHPVFSEYLNTNSNTGISHIELAQHCDAIIIAPATANTIAKIRMGFADNLLTAVILATTAPKFIAPAMNSNMYNNIATQENIDVLAQRGMTIIGPATGFQACGATGTGRMSEPEEIVEALSNHLASTNVLTGKKILITAGPTEEAIDPVRFITNRSSGKMGYALAEAAQKLGAEVTLISGPVFLDEIAGITTVQVRTAEAMLNAVLKNLANQDVFISCAAVADFKPKVCATQKIKKTADDDEMVIELVKNPDILATVGHSNERPDIVIGFAAETQNVEQNALIKLNKKGADFIIANDVSRCDIGFNSDNNSVTIYSFGYDKMTFKEMPKKQLSIEILKYCLLNK